MSLTYDKQYYQILERIMSEGVDVVDRTGVGTREVFDVNINTTIEHDGDKHTLPLLGLRTVYPRSMWMELFWMLRGSVNANELKERNIRIWDVHSSREYLDSRGLHHIREGFIGDSYGKQFRNFNGVDQLANLLKGIVSQPTSRRHIISLWNPAELESAALPCCHVMYNFMVSGDTIHLKFFQRSSDFMLAGNANFIFASFFLTWVAVKTGYKTGMVSHAITNCHLYKNHLEIADELLGRELIDSDSTYTFPDSGIRFNSDADVERLLDHELELMWNQTTWDTIRDSLYYKSHEKIDPERMIIAQ